MTQPADDLAAFDAWKSASEKFEANRASPIVYGSVRSTGGAYYTLDNGRSFVLSRDDCARINLRVGMPRWKLP